MKCLASAVRGDCVVKLKYATRVPPPARVVLFFCFFFLLHIVKVKLRLTAPLIFARVFVRLLLPAMRHHFPVAACGRSRLTPQRPDSGVFCVSSSPCRLFSTPAFQTLLIPSALLLSLSRETFFPAGIIECPPRRKCHSVLLHSAGTVLCPSVSIPYKCRW